MVLTSLLADQSHCIATVVLRKHGRIYWADRIEFLAKQLSLPSSAIGTVDLPDGKVPLNSRCSPLLTLTRFRNLLIPRSLQQNLRLPSIWDAR